jgi:mannose-1-phosphate guanylyltransferase / mannose-6-phosphate isomerase
MSRPIYPLVLCGGMGSRLWPVSRIEQPKQFQPIAGKGSLSYFQTTLQRHRGHDFHAPIIVTNARHGALVDRQLREIQLQATILAEPVARNTGPAVLAAALVALEADADAQLLVLPSDHFIKGNLNSTILSMRDAAEAGRIIMFGVVPDYPETGYGYLTDGGGFANYPGLHRVLRFVEKPPADEARKLVESGHSYWASGISLFRADLLLEEFRRLDPTTVDAVMNAVTAGHRTESYSGRTHLLLDEQAFEGAQNQPTEKIVFERSAAVSLAPLRGIQWDDIGAWKAVHQVSARNEAGNATSGDVIAIDTRNSLIRSDGRLVAVVGLDDVVVVDTPDAVLVTTRNQSQNVKMLVDRLIAENRTEARSHALHDTSWGQIETLSRAHGCDVRMITVQPGASLRVNGTGLAPSMLTILAGEGEISISGTTTRVLRGQSIPIDADFALPLSNPTGQDLMAIQLIFAAANTAEPSAAAKSPADIRRDIAKVLIAE